jgi:hypothetical protein
MGRNSIDRFDHFNGETIDQVIDRKIARRTFLKGAIALPLVSLARHSYMRPLTPPRSTNCDFSRFFSATKTSSRLRPVTAPMS